MKDTVDPESETGNVYPLSSSLNINQSAHHRPQEVDEMRILFSFLKYFIDNIKLYLPNMATYVYNNSTVIQTDKWIIEFLMISSDCKCILI